MYRLKEKLKKNNFKNNKIPLKSFCFCYYYYFVERTIAKNFF